MHTQPSCRFAIFLLVLTALMQGCANTAARRFESPAQAADSLAAALRADDRAQLGDILGSDADDLLSSGDPVNDRNTRDAFLERYDAGHKLIQEPAGDMTLVVGDGDWPLPIPIVKDPKQGTWYFDTAAGKDEILNRRIGRNELAAIATCLAIVDAQREYALEDRDGNGVRDYARQFLSDPGRKNGLYWQVGAGEAPSPLGPLISLSAGEGYTAAGAGSGRPQPYHGYCYRILKAQGSHGRGGAFDYLVNGKMIGGFAVVAYPAEHGNSGIMTFIVNHDAVVYEQDLGSGTAAKARRMSAFDPGEDWSPVEAAETILP